jgi:probable rRNA maturation factor
MRLRFACAPGCRPPAGTRAPLEELAAGLAPDGILVQVVLGRDPLLRRLNRSFRGRDRSTDVLSFRYAGAAPRSRLDPVGYVEAAGPDGEVYVSLDRAAAQARAHGHTTAEEFVLLVLHGLLHLQGHDHHTPREVRRMHGAEVRALGRLRRRWPEFTARPMLDAPRSVHRVA